MNVRHQSLSLVVGIVLSGLACGGGATGGTGHATGGAGGSHAGGSGGSNATGGSGGSGGDVGSVTGGSGGDLGSGGSAGSGSEPDASPGEDSGGAGGTDSTPDASGGSTGASGDASTGGSVDGPVVAGCTLRWSPSAMRDGKNAFEGLEMPDTNGVHPNAVHFSTVAEHDAFRVDQHDNPPTAIDYDQKATDRLRCEVKGMRTGTTNLELLNGQTWRIQWSILVPATLKGSTRFNHIWQMKYVDTAGASSDGPVLTLDLTRSGADEKIRLDVFSQYTFAGASFSHDKWLTNEVTLKIAPGTGGSVHWTLRDGATVLADAEKTGISTWPANAARLRPKWGIYRSLGDTSGDVQTTYIEFSDMLGYSCP